MNKFKKNIVMKWRLEIITGLHIGGGKEGVKIGGTDNPVIKTFVKYKRNENDPGTIVEMPYIPGSSVKGKIRYLLETAYKGQEDKEKLIKKLFGVGASEKENESSDKGNEYYPTRLIIRDAYPTREWIEKLVMEDIYEKGTEIKPENSIDRNNGGANPRFIERVIPGLEFELETIITVFEGDDEKALISLLNEGISLLRDSYLGGQGTRGYGRIEIKNENVEERDIMWYEEKMNMG
ncbi:MAG: type III-A CRISPR-associated RAMP protein Csm3 [Thermoplasmata archaeon]